MSVFLQARRRKQLVSDKRASRWDAARTRTRSDVIKELQNKGLLQEARASRGEAQERTVKLESEPIKLEFAESKHVPKELPEPVKLPEPESVKHVPSELPEPELDRISTISNNDLTEEEMLFLERIKRKKSSKKLNSLVSK